MGGEHLCFPDGLRYIKILKASLKNGGIIQYEIRTIENAEITNLYSCYNLLNHVNTSCEIFEEFFPKFKDNLIADNVDFLPVWIWMIEKLVRYFDKSPSQSIELQRNMSRTDLYSLIDKKEFELFPSYAVNSHSRRTE
jgi:hypothetical protein